jgi:hypothetical protein
MLLDGWFLDAAVGNVRGAAKPAKVHSRSKCHATGEVPESRPALYWRGEVGVLGALDTSSERLTALIGWIAVTAQTLMSLYTPFVSALPKAAAVLPVTSAVTPFVITISAAVMGPVVLCSGFPRSFVGLQTDNWKSALAFSVLVSLAFLAAAASLKLALIHTTETFSSCSLFQAMFAKTCTRSPLWVALGLYLALAPLQEFVVRRCLQAPLHAFLSGTGHRRVWSILVSDLVFSAAHAHISILFAAAAFIPGLLWGWIFAGIAPAFVEICLAGLAG